MKYRHDPDNPDTPFVEASPADVHSLRSAIFGYLARWGVPSRDREDLVQWVELATWKNLQDGRVRGSAHRSPKVALLCHMIGRAWYLRQNYRNRASTKNELFLEDIETLGPLATSFMDEIEARDLLRRIAARPRTMRTLLDAALGESSPKRSADEGIPSSTYSAHLKNARRWVRDLHASGRWREPPKSPKPRKGKGEK